MLFPFRHVFCRFPPFLTVYFSITCHQIWHLTSLPSYVATQEHRLETTDSCHIVYPSGGPRMFSVRHHVHHHIHVWHPWSGHSHANKFALTPSATVRHRKFVFQHSFSPLEAIFYALHYYFINVIHHIKKSTSTSDHISFYYILTSIPITQRKRYAKSLFYTLYC